MKISVSKYGAILTWLLIYFTSKILWDNLIPTVIELFSLAVLAYGAFNFFWTKKKKKSYAIVFIFYAVFCVYILSNGVLQDTTQQLGRAIYEYCFYFLMFFSFAFYIEKTAKIFECLKIVNLWGIFIALLSWYEYITKSYILNNNFITTIKSIYGFRAAVFTRSYLSHAMVLAFFSLIALYLYCYTKKKKYLFSCAFCGVSLLTTSSRGPLVALIISFGVFYLMNMYRKGVKPSKKVWMFFSIIIVLLMGWIFLNSTFVTGNDTIDYFLYRTRQIVNWTGDAGNVGRIGTWQLAIKYFESNICFGIGPSHTGSWGSGSIGVTESGYLKFLCELGILGSLILGVFIISVINVGKKQYKENGRNDNKLFMILCFALITLVMINNITVQSSEEIQVMFIWAMGMGGLLKNYSDLREHQSL